MIIAIEIKNNNKTLRGMIHKPESKNKVPLAVFCHGFTGHKHEKHNMFVKTARALEEAGIASLRFDFAGSGESDGDFRDMTFSSEVSDALSAVEYARSLDFVDASHIYIIGLSMGGAVAGAAAAQRGDVAKLCIWAGAGDLYNVLKNFIIAETGGYVLDDSGYIDVSGNITGKALLKEAERTDVFAQSVGYTNPVMIVHGDNDTIVPVDNAYRYKEIYGDRASLHIVKGANHTFDSREWETDVIQKTVEFLSQEE